jgi:DNA-binding Lrp family transcriptional regulator
MNSAQQMNPTERRKLITDYISTNPGCNQQDIVRHLEGKSSRQTVLNDIDQLEEDEIIYYITQKENSRDHNFYVQDDNILVSVSKELDEFDKNFFSALMKIKEKFDKLYLKTKKDHVIKKDQSIDETKGQNLVAFQPLLNVLSQSVEILYEVLDVYILRCVLIWPETIKKEDVIKRLYSILFSKISDIQLRMSKILSSFEAGNFYLVTQLSIYQRIYRTANFQRHLDDFKLLKINEIEPLLDSVWKINKDFLLHSCPEPVLYKWDFDYKKDNWKKLLDLQRKHPEQTYRNLVNQQLTYLSKPIE